MDPGKYNLTLQIIAEGSKSEKKIEISDEELLLLDDLLQLLVKGEEEDKFAWQSQWPYCISRFKEFKEKLRNAYKVYLNTENGLTR